MDEKINNSMKSGFNEGFFQIQRLHYSWTLCQNYSRTGNLNQWRWVLSSIWRELSKDALRLGDNDPFVNKYYKNVVDLDTVINIAVKRKKFGLLYDFLNRKEILLRGLQEDAGKGGKWVDSDVDSMDD